MSASIYSSLPPIKSGPYHAWFSAEAAAFAGSGIWLHEDGREVEVTLAHDDRAEAEHLYGWDDSVYLGMVTKRLRAGRKGTFEPPPAVYAPYLPS